MGRITYRRSRFNPAYWVIYDWTGRPMRIMHISRDPRDVFPSAVKIGD